MENRPLKKYSSCYPPRKNHRTVPRPRRPDAIVPRFVDVDLALLGKRTPYLIIDVDNTLALSKSPTLSEGVAQHIDRARDRDHIRDVCLLSNTILPSSTALARVQRFAAQLHAHYVVATFPYVKPSPIPFRRAMALMGSEPYNTAVIGDQVYTDMVGAQRLGLYCVLVFPLGEDHWSTKLTLRRVRERRLRKVWALSSPPPPSIDSQIARVEGRMS